MFEETLDRLDGFIPLDRTLVVTGAYLEEQIKATSNKFPGLKVLFEPQGKNTCLALALAAAHIRMIDPKGVMVVLSSDHMIEPKEQLVRILSAAADVAANEAKLITIGIIPSRAETGYGYIEMGPRTSEVNGIKFHSVIKFKEKPERTKAQEYYLDRRHLWNSGMFVWSVETFLNALNKYMPEMSACLDTYFKSLKSKGNGEALKCLYNDCESISVDFAILEKADNVLCVRGEVKWDDVGSWLALERIHSANQEGNVTLGQVILDSSYENTVVNAGEDGLVVGFGITDLVVVKTGNIVMVAHKTRVNDIKELLSHLDKDEKFKQYL
jgi:mannose-1-phosphate guanylyltransferase